MQTINPSLAAKIEHLTVFDITLEMVVDVYGANADGRSSEQDIARLEGEEATDVGNEAVDREQHVRGSPLLHGVAVDIEMEV